jgi:hypothetical protein
VPFDEFGLADADLLRAQVAFAVGWGGEAPPLPLQAAKQFEPLNVSLARDTYLEATAAAQFAGRLASADDVFAVAQEEAIRWLWLACRVAIEVWDFERWDLLSTRLVAWPESPARWWHCRWLSRCGPEWTFSPVS